MAEQIDLTGMGPEEFRDLVGSTGDSELKQAFEVAGTEAVLDRIFEGFTERFRPDRAQDVDAVTQFVVTDGGDEHPYAVTIRDGTCTIEQGRSDDPKVALTTDVVSFAKLVTGHAAGPALFMMGKLKVNGDLMFAQRFMNFFDRPGS